MVGAQYEKGADKIDRRRKQAPESQETHRSMPTAKRRAAKKYFWTTVQKEPQGHASTLVFYRFPILMICVRVRGKIHGIGSTITNMLKMGFAGNAKTFSKIKRDGKDELESSRKMGRTTCLHVCFFSLFILLLNVNVSHATQPHRLPAQ